MGELQASLEGIIEFDGRNYLILVARSRDLQRIQTFLRVCTVFVALLSLLSASFIGLNFLSVVCGCPALMWCTCVQLAAPSWSSLSPLGCFIGGSPLSWSDCVDGLPTSAPPASETLPGGEFAPCHQHRMSSHLRSEEG